MALKLCLHIDSDHTPLSPFETEMGRRVWWHICVLDIRTAEDEGCVPYIRDSFFDCRLPANVDDINLDPRMSVKPIMQAGRTEMLFSLVRFEVSYFTRRIVFPDKFCLENGHKVLSPREKCEAIDQFQQSIEIKYLMYCDKGVPLDFVTSVSTRLILVRLKLEVTKPRAGQNRPLMPQNFRGICIELLQYSRLLRQDEVARQWLWLFQTYVEWEALACLLLDLCFSSSKAKTDLAWATVKEVYEYWKQYGAGARRSPRWVNVEKLYRQTVAVRDGQPNPSQISNTDGQRCEVAGVDNLVYRNCMAEWTDAAVEESANACSPSVSTGEAAEMPTAGTLCEWSAGVFEQYLEIMDPSRSKNL